MPEEPKRSLDTEGAAEAVKGDLSSADEGAFDALLKEKYGSFDNGTDKYVLIEGFTLSLAEHLNEQSEISVEEVKEKDLLLFRHLIQIIMLYYLQRIMIIFLFISKR